MRMVRDSTSLMRRYSGSSGSGDDGSIGGSEGVILWRCKTGKFLDGNRGFLVTL